MSAAGNSNSMTTTFIVYGAILIIAVFQVLFAMMSGPSLALMLFLGFLQASLGVMYFMHLGQERHSLFLVLIPCTLFVVFMMNMIWSDSFRLLRMHSH